MLTEITDDDGHVLNAKVEVINGNIVLHSRGGAFGKPNLRNPDYRQALRAILERLVSSNLKVSAIWLDSSVARQWPESERLLVQGEELDAPVEALLTAIAKQGSSKGRSDGESGHGNSTKRLKIGVPSGSMLELQKVISGRAAWSDTAEPEISSGTLENEVAIQGTESDVDEERTWAEGSLRRVTHLRRERASGLAKAKKEAFVAEHGFLFCERCELIPSEQLGPYGDACIEVHDNGTAISAMTEPTETKLSDLQCITAQASG
jgi:hypothetical protein